MEIKRLTVDHYDELLDMLNYTFGHKYGRPMDFIAEQPKMWVRDNEHMNRHLAIFEDGKLACIVGADRFCSYLGVPMTGDYDSFACQNGTKSLEELKKEPYLHVVSISDFQCDPFSGHFGGEIRLAYFFDGKEVKAITGGSINGSISDCKDSLQFSLERYHSLSFNGPKAVRLAGVKVAGAGEE